MTQTTFEHLGQAELDDIILKHNMFIRGKPGGSRANLKFKDMRGLDFRASDLSGADFTASVMVNSNLSGGNFTNAVFYGCDMRQANLENAIFRRADFRGAYIAGANLARADLESADMREGKILEKGAGGQVIEREDPSGKQNPRTVLTGSRMTETNLSGVRASSADFSDADLSGVIMKGADLRHVNFTGANLTRTDFSFSDLRNTNLRGAIMTETILKDTESAGLDDEGALKDEKDLGKKFDTDELDLNTLIKEHVSWITTVGKQGRQLDLSGYDLRSISNLKQYPLTALIAQKSTFLNLDLKGIHMQSALVDHSDFRDCNLARADLRGFSANGANFARADLTGANLGALHFGKPTDPNYRLKPVQLEGTDLRYAQLSGVNLSDANLMNADLTGANLTHADLRRADLTGAKLKGSRLEGALTDGAKMPESV